MIDLFEIEDAIWDKLYDEYSEKIIEEIKKSDTSHYEFADEDDLYLCFCEDCIKRVISEDEFATITAEMVTEYVDDYNDCVSYLNNYTDMDGAINDYISSDDFEAPFSLIDCARWYIRDCLNYDYEDMIYDVKFALLEDYSMCEDEKVKLVINSLRKECYS